MKRAQKKKIIFWVILFFFLAGSIFFLLPPKNRIPVLMYHFIYPDQNAGTDSLNVGVSHFERQMWFLRTFGFRPISLDEFNEIKTGKTKPRGREVLITFDDGHSTYLKYALPILERYKIPSANFLIWDHLQRRWESDMSLEQAQELTHQSLIMFGSHTLSHPALTRIPLEQAKTEIVQSKKELEKALAKPVDYFCYPEGDANPEVMKLVEEAGYRLAFTTSRKHLQGRSETAYSIVRFKIKPTDNLFVFWLTVSGIGPFFKEMEASWGRLTAVILNDKLLVYDFRLDRLSSFVRSIKSNINFRRNHLYG